MEFYTCEKIRIPYAGWTACHIQMVQMYLTYCKENEFEPFGKNSHFEILRACMASSRTNLYGLDNTAAEELELFRHFKIFLKILEKIYLFVKIHTKNYRYNFHQVVYMKTDYKIHVKKS